MWRRYLMWFAHEHIDFRHAEMQSILSLYDIPIKYIEKPCVNKPYWIVEFPTEDCIQKVASRSVLLKNCFELWGRAKTLQQLHENLRKSLTNSTGNWIIEDSDTEASDKHICPKTLIDSSCPPHKTFKIEVETFCKHFTMKEKVNKIETFNYLPLKGTVRLKNPDITLGYLEFYGVDPNNVPEDPQPLDVFFGKWVADGQRELIQTYSLKKRSFIGNTSMDAQLAVLMANQAQVNSGDLVVDPFVGSGSLLVAAAHFGGYVWGSDIDFLMLHGRTRPTRVGQKVRTKEESIEGNMKQYGTESRYLDVIVSDFSLPIWHERLKFAAIITDPPYGVREPTEKIGIEKENYSLNDVHLSNHVPSKVEYDLGHLYRDLLCFAAKHLVVGGRLVCWYPLTRDEYNPDDIPSHPCLELVANSEQILSKLTARRMLTYHKTCEVDNDVTIDAKVRQNFREKYFAYDEITRKERREKKAEELAANEYYINKSKLNKLNGVT